jgi:hypothetical protein
MNTNKTTAAAVKALHQKVQGALKSSLQYARQAGEKLAKVSAVKTSYDFVKWVTKEVGISESTAYCYIRVFKHWHEVKDAENYVAALKALRKTRKPKEVPPAPVLSAWEQSVAKKMIQYRIRGRLDDVILFLESYGVTDPKPLAA